MLDDKELKRLQKLANIKLNETEEKKLSTQLEQIIQFLGKLSAISSAPQGKHPQLTLRTLPGTKAFPDTQKLLQNVEHPLINNSIVIKSVLG